MIGRFRNALYNAIGNLDVENAPNGSLLANGSGSHDGSSSTSSRHSFKNSDMKVKYAYQRPIFLQMFTDDEIQVTADHLVRPIMVPRDIQILPWFAGYAEAINAGKSLRNEDQASFHRGVLRTQDAPEDDLECDREWEIPYVYFGIFDGHAGSGCAVTAANELHQMVHKKLMGILHHLVPDATCPSSCGQGVMWFPSRDISVESLVIGALESAFWEMDHQIGDDKRRYKMLGGCTVLVSLFILGKLYVANAGDSRGVLCRNKTPYPMSFDFTPVSERQRLQQLGFQKPQLLGNEYTHVDYCRRPLRNDVGKKMLYRDAHMTGWSYKEITPDDLKFPVVYGEGKRSRLLATIGVTRGFGDHDLKAQSQNGSVFIKPFLTPQPEVKVLDVEHEAISEADVLVMATDGLWDVVSNEKVAEVVHNGLKLYEEADEERQKYRFISIAQDLVMAARGKLVERNWQRNDETPATIDDISVIAIPILAYKKEYAEWESEHRYKELKYPKSASTPSLNGKASPKVLAKKHKETPRTDIQPRKPEAEPLKPRDTLVAPTNSSSLKSPDTSTADEDALEAEINAEIGVEVSADDDQINEESVK
ncbi:protein phosphatase 1H-like [Tigriopus californicus]|nr:protein phosphatase 1H-like [Tigriopus californicus]|eukprot:TCALIF_05976-PA protein Name:"Similar to Ppm1h Protein phosphatase 1H (Mus musculus)" AED:0.18 eAED:0.32 QI:0/-1/0/1/-1/1/1/0/591